MQTTDDCQYIEPDAKTMELLDTGDETTSPSDKLKDAGNTISSFFQKGWKSLKKGVQTTSERIKESEVAQKTTEKMQQVKNSDFGKKVAMTTTKTKVAVKDTMKKSGKAIKNGYEKVKESEFAKKTKQHMDDVRQKFSKRSTVVQSRESVSIVCLATNKRAM